MVRNQTLQIEKDFYYMKRSEIFYMIPRLLKYQRSGISEPEFINRKRTTNKPIFISQAIYDILPNTAAQKVFWGRLEDKAYELWAHNRYEIVFNDIWYFEEQGIFRIYKQEYGSVVLLDDEPEPPRHL